MCWSNIINTSFTNLTHEKFEELFDELIPYDGDDSDKVLGCNIVITVDYITKVIVMEFSTTLMSDIHTTVSDLALLDTTFTRLPIPQLISKLMITCPSSDKCDKSFILNDDHYQWWWLIDEIDHTTIERMFYQLFINDLNFNGSIQCVESFASLWCANKSCATVGVESGEFYPICGSPESESIHLRIRARLNINSNNNKFKHWFTYTCQFDFCNDYSIFHNVSDVIREHYNISSMARIFNARPTTTSSTTTITSTTSIRIETTAKSSATGISLKLSIKIILFIVQLIHALLLF